jgi:hypothetical protein
VSSSSTNKQPLLVDRPLLEIRRLDATTATSNDVDPATGTSGVLLVDCTSGDGALIESIWLIQRVAGNATPVNLYLSTSNQLLGSLTDGGSAGSWFLGQAGFDVGPDPGGTVEFDLPKLLAPVPHAGANADASPLQFRGLRLQEGQALWACVASTSAVPGAPLIAAQGGYY